MVCGYLFVVVVGNDGLVLLFLYLVVYDGVVVVMGVDWCCCVLLEVCCGLYV